MACKMAGREHYGPAERAKLPKQAAGSKRSRRAKTKRAAKIAIKNKERAGKISRATRAAAFKRAAGTIDDF